MIFLKPAFHPLVYYPNKKNPKVFKSYLCNFTANTMVKVKTIKHSGPKDNATSLGSKQVSKASRAKKKKRKWKNMKKLPSAWSTTPDEKNHQQKAHYERKKRKCIVKIDCSVYHYDPE